MAEESADEIIEDSDKYERKGSDESAEEIIRDSSRKKIKVIRPKTGFKRFMSNAYRETRAAAGSVGRAATNAYTIAASGFPSRPPMKAKRTGSRRSKGSRTMYVNSRGVPIRVIRKKTARRAQSRPRVNVMGGTFGGSYHSSGTGLPRYANAGRVNVLGSGMGRYGGRGNGIGGLNSGLMKRKRRSNLLGI